MAAAFIISNCGNKDSLFVQPLSFREFEAKFDRIIKEHRSLM